MSSDSRTLIKAAYAYCHVVNKTHYENFPVASLFLPRRVRPAIDAIYAFSRVADDFADEKQFHGQRMARLSEWESYLNQDEPTHPIFVALKDAMRTFNIPKSLFLDLLAAFKQDVVKSRYQSFRDVLEYCRHSANPIGRMVLTVCGEANEATLRLSDAVCTALQLANFWQDVAVDAKKDRIYLPEDELQIYGVGELDLFAGKMTKDFKKLLKFQVERTREFFRMGHGIGLTVRGRLGIELRLTWLSGMRILDLIERNDYDVFQRRPMLSKSDFIKMIWVALSRRWYEKY